MKISRERLEYEGQRTLRWIQRQGVVFYPEKPERETAKRYLRGMSKIFPELVGQLRAIYLYRMSEQGNKTYDGILWKNVTTDGRGTLYAIGISLEAISHGPQYLQRLFVHELAHILAPCAPGTHSTEFHVTYQKLLHQYDEATGSCLEAGREISAADRAAVEHMRENGPPPPAPSTKIPVTVLTFTAIYGDFEKGVQNEENEANFPQRFQAMDAARGGAVHNPRGRRPDHAGRARRCGSRPVTYAGTAAASQQERKRSGGTSEHDPAAGQRDISSKTSGGFLPLVFC